MYVMSKTMRQKAPSAKRCIKTSTPHPYGDPSPSHVRKHRAPKGALRPYKVKTFAQLIEGQKAPSAKRCIKTSHSSDAHG